MARFVMVTVPTGKREAVIELLKKEDIEFSVSDETSGRDFSCVVQFPLPTNAVEPILDKLKEIGVHDDSITVTLETQTVVSRDFEALQERYEEEEESPEQIARHELQSAARDLVPASLRVYVGMTIASAAIATAGLLLNSAAVVVGSMVIAPLIGPAMATNVGTVFRQRDLVSQGLKLQILGLGLSVVAAGVLALVIKSANLVPPGLDILAIDQIRERFRPDVLSLVVAVGSGIAGVISLASGLSSALVGVMIAVALIPPAATVGIGIAWGNGSLVLGSSVLLLVNVLCINLAALVMLWYMGYRPDEWFRVKQTKRDLLRRAGLLIASILVLSAFLGGVTFASYEVATAEQSIQADIEETLDANEIDLVLLDVDYEYSQNLLARSPTQVTILLGIPQGEVPSNIGEVINARIDEIAGRDVSVQLRFLYLQQPN